MRKKMNVLSILTLLLIGFGTVTAQQNTAFLHNQSLTCDIGIEIEWIGQNCSGISSVTNDIIPANTIMALTMPPCPDCIPINFMFYAPSTGQSSQLFEIYISGTGGPCVLNPNSQGAPMFPLMNFDPPCSGSSGINPPNQIGLNYTPWPANNLGIIYRP